MTEKGYTQGIYIDGVFYDIPFVSIKRKADFLEKYAERTEDGDIKMETIGCYFNYDITVGTIDDTETYNKLFEHITQVQPRFHNVVLPDGTSNYSFRGYFSSISDEVSKVLENKVKFDELKFKMTSQKPTKK
jgi:hypothetical protein